MDVATIKQHRTGYQAVNEEKAANYQQRVFLRRLFADLTLAVENRPPLIWPA